MKKILIIYATAGIGHKKAAVAVKKALDEIAPKDVEVSLIDALDYTNAFFKWTYLKIYLLMVNKLPLFWGLSYYITDNFYVNLMISKLRRLNNWANSKRFIKYLLDTKPDVVVTTHFFSNEVISDLRKKGLLNTHLITVVTDYRLHSWWISDFVDTYVVADQDAKGDLVKWNIAPERVKVLGIPVEPMFLKKLDKKNMFEDTHLKEGIFTVLIIGGGFGVGPIEDIIKVIDSVSEPIQVIAICGHNESLVKRLEDLRLNLKMKLKVLGFVDNVYEYMEVSNILISKSGGITVSEALAKEIPMIIISPILGQETRNSDFLVKAGAALRIRELRDLRGILEDLSSNPDRIGRMKEAIRMIRMPTACYDIAKLTIEMCGERDG